MGKTLFRYYTSAQAHVCRSSTGIWMACTTCRVCAHLDFTSNRNEQWNGSEKRSKWWWESESERLNTEINSNSSKRWRTFLRMANFIWMVANVVCVRVPDYEHFVWWTWAEGKTDRKKRCWAQENVVIRSQTIFGLKWDRENDKPNNR